MATRIALVFGLIGIVIALVFGPIGITAASIFGFIAIAIVFISRIIGLSYMSQGDSFKKGAIGEQMVSDVLQRYPDDWYIFNDMIVGNSQIDHIVVCPKGIYTIETKNYSGSIYGNSNDRYWTQVTHGFQETSFYSPVKQGKKHSYDLSQYLKMFGYNHWINTIVVFTNPESEIDVYSDIPVVSVEELDMVFYEKKNILRPDLCAEIATCIYDLVPNKQHYM